MKKADSRQIRAIYAIGGALGISENHRDDNLHVLISGITGKESVKELSYREAEEVIRALKERQGSYTPKPMKKKKDGTLIPGGMTEGQKRKCWALMYQIEQESEPSTASAGERLCGVIEKVAKVTSVPKDPFRFLDYHGGNKVIEALKGYIKSIKRKEARTDDTAGQDTG